MAEKGTKKQEGKTEERTVLVLTPVKYSISLHYLGEKYVKRDEQKYRCRYLFKTEAGASLETLPQCIENLVTGIAPDQDSEDAATPQGGLKNPGTDKAYRLLVTDNHSLASVDARLLGNRGSPNGDTVSKPAYYKRSNRKWMKDVQPAAPFRVIIRKFHGFDGKEEQVDLDDTLKVVIEVKDPVEETSVYAVSDNNTVENCLNDFFKKYNRTDEDPTQGDDNCLDFFKGHRKPSNSKPGVQASKVIKAAPYIKPPTLDTAKDEDLEFKKISSKGNYKTMWVKLDIKNEKLSDGGKDIKVGISDFVFSPLPIGGDNYRFLIWLVNNSGKDVRDTKINKAEVFLLDDKNADIPKPRAYCTGRIVIWRKIDIRLLLTANTLPAADINWGTVKSYYEHTFTEISDPIETIELPLTGWRQSIIDVFNAGAATGDYANMNNFRPAGTNPGDPTYNDIYSVGMFPAFMLPRPGNATTDLRNLCDDILNKAVAALDPVQNPALTAEDRNITRTGEGIYMFYARCNAGGLLGVWLGNGKLMVGKHTGAYAGETNETTAHEMAHGFFLRHSNTTTQRRWNAAANSWVPFIVRYETTTGVSNTVINLIDPKWNCFPQDHDQNYSFKCTMSYLQEQQFCAICALTLRFLDKVEIQKNSRFGDRIMEGFFEDPTDPNNEAKIVYLEYNVANPNNLNLKEDIPNLAKNTEMYLMAVGPEEAYVAAGAPSVGRVNISCAHKTPASLWKSSNTAVLSISIVGDLCIEVKGKKPGTASITYSRNGKSVSADITVT
ncbi:MAG TPA: hypothetical protein ENN05_11205 [Deltaproteobacteria bacterium]|nr:hypothetical protein [Deltaproteobacteria bacterium]